MPLCAPLALVLAPCLLQPGGTAQPPANPPGPRVQAWPVHTVDCERHPAGRSPVLVVGSLFTGGHCYREDDGNRVHLTPPGEVIRPSPCVGNKYSHAMNEYLLGNIRPRPSCDEEETCVFLTSPPLDNGFEFTVDSIELQGTAWTIHATYWHDETKHQWSPGPNREAQMVRLGWLRPGEYTCRLELSTRTLARGIPLQGVYNETLRQFAAVAFTVGKGDPWNFHPWDQEPSKAVIRESDLKPLSFQASADRQMPYYAARRADAKGIDQPFAKAGLAPALDWTKYGQKSQTLWETPGDGTASLLVARVKGGKPQEMGRHDWAEITSIEWERDSAPAVHIRARIWRRAMNDGKAPETTIPEFAVPLVTKDLAPIAELAKTLKVTVDWSEAPDNPRNPETDVAAK